MHNKVSELKKVVKSTGNGNHVTLYEITPKWVTSLKLDDRKTGINRRNREIDISHITRLLSDIISGNWCDLINPICYIDEPQHPDHGRLCSGQHRLEAIRKSGTTQLCEIRGVSAKASAFMDIVRKRSVAQNISMEHGYSDFTKDANTLSSLDAFIRFIKGNVWTNQGSCALTIRKTQSDMKSFWRDNEVSFQEVRTIHSHLNKNTVRGFIVLLKLGGVPSDKIREFTKNISTSDTGDDFIDHLHSSVGTVKPYQICIDIWNYMVTGNQVMNGRIPLLVDLNRIKL